jgi:hypothetical protein
MKTHPKSLSQGQQLTKNSNKKLPTVNQKTEASQTAKPRKYTTQQLMAATTRIQ